MPHSIADYSRRVSALAVVAVYCMGAASFASLMQAAPAGTPTRAATPASTTALKAPVVAAAVVGRSPNRERRAGEPTPGTCAS
jgi:hypothetical protein